MVQGKRTGVVRPATWLVALVGMVGVVLGGFLAAPPAQAAEGNTLSLSVSPEPIAHQDVVTVTVRVDSTADVNGNVPLTVKIPEATSGWGLIGSDVHFDEAAFRLDSLTTDSGGNTIVQLTPLQAGDGVAFSGSVVIAYTAAVQGTNPPASTTVSYTAAYDGASQSLDREFTYSAPGPSTALFAKWSTSANVPSMPGYAGLDINAAGHNGFTLPVNYAHVDLKDVVVTDTAPSYTRIVEGSAFAGVGGPLLTASGSTGRPSMTPGC